jgi:hypothetical protein
MEGGRVKKIVRTSKRMRTASAGLVLALILPGLLGGCPEFRNDVLDSLQTATQGVLVGGVQPPDALETAATGVVTAMVNLAFDALRVEERR